MSLGRVTSIKCPYCGALGQPGVHNVQSDHAAPPPGRKNDSHSGYAALCGSCCGRPYLVWHLNNGVVDWMHPRYPGVEAPDHLPEGIASDFEEARSANAGGLLRACLLLCRRCIEAAAEDKGCKQSKLWLSIDEMHKKGFILESMRKGAHAVRLFGNNGAHDADLGGKAPDDAELLEVLTYTRDFLFQVYDVPFLSEQLAARQRGEQAQ